MPAGPRSPGDRMVLVTDGVTKAENLHVGGAIAEWPATGRKSGFLSELSAAEVAAANEHDP